METIAENSKKLIFIPMDEFRARLGIEDSQVIDIEISDMPGKDDEENTISGIKTTSCKGSPWL